MDNAIGIEDFLRDRDAWQIIDVRSPGEFIVGHIPGAVNIPLFTDEERARVGTIYTQVSPEDAFREGLQIAGLKMTHLVDSVKPFTQTPGKEILIHCWRGGKRSKAVQWLFNFSGSHCTRLDGGYKQFRGALQSFFNSGTFDIRILGGCTGSGKTEILAEMARLGEQVIDLEAYAHHKGSAFGSIGEEPQPTTEQFENNLFIAFLSLDLQRPIWLENESKSIGKVNIPDGLWESMRKSWLYTIDVDKEIRLDRALRYYSEPIDVGVLKNAFERIYKRIGGLDYQSAIKALEDGDLRSAAAIALKYYDKAYNFQLSAWPADKVVPLQECNDVKRAAELLIHKSVIAL